MATLTTLHGYAYHLTWLCLPSYMATLTTLHGHAYHLIWLCLPSYMATLAILNGYSYLGHERDDACGEGGGVLDLVARAHGGHIKNERGKVLDGKVS